MKIAIRVFSILIFLILGWLLHTKLFMFTADHLKSNGFVISVQKPLEIFFGKVYFTFIFAMIPVFMRQSTKFLKYKSKVFEVSGFFVIAFFGMLLAVYRGFSVVGIRTTWNKDYETSISFQSLKINRYLFIGILIGILLFLGLGFLTKQIKSKRKIENEKRLAQQNIGRIGGSDH